MIRVYLIRLILNFGVPPSHRRGIISAPVAYFVKYISSHKIFFFFVLIQAKLYINGDKDHCSIAAKGKRAFIGFVDLQPNEAKSVVAPIVPKRTGEIPIQVDAVFQIKFNGNFLNTFGDSVKRKLLVVVRIIIKCAVFFQLGSFLKFQTSFQASARF